MRAVSQGTATRHSRAFDAVALELHIFGNFQRRPATRMGTRDAGRVPSEMEQKGA